MSAKIDYAEADDQQLKLIVSEAEADIAKLADSQESYAPAAIRGLKADRDRATDEIGKRLKKVMSEAKGKIGKAAKALVRLIKREESIKPETVSLEIVPEAELLDHLAKADKKASKVEPNGHAVALALKDLVIGSEAEQAEALISLKALAPEIKGGQTLKIVELPKGTIKDLSLAYSEKYKTNVDEIADGFRVHAKHWRKAPGPRGQRFKIVFEDRNKSRASMGKAIKDKAIKIGNTVATACYVPGKGKDELEGTVPTLVDRLIRVGDLGFAKAHKANGGSRNWLPDFLEPLGKAHGFKIEAVTDEADKPADIPEADKAKAADVTDHENGLPKPASEDQKPADKPTEDGKVGGTDTVASVLKAEGAGAGEKALALAKAKAK